MAERKAGTSPAPPLPRYYREAAERDAFVRHLFDRGAASYDRINGVLSFGKGARYRRDALRRAGLAPGQRLLDVVIGTGLVAREALAILGRAEDVMGLDLSAGMLRETRRNLPVPLAQARAEALPLADANVDFVSMGDALRHAPDLVLAFSEYARVLRPGGRVMLLEIDEPPGRVAHGVLRFYLGTLVPAASRLLGQSADAQVMIRYFWDTIESCVPPETITGALAEAGFAEIGCDIQLGIFRAYTATRPG